MKHHHPMQIGDKKNGGRVTLEFLQERAERSMAAGYTKQKWIEFCETLLAEGYEIRLYEARQTVSKYVTVSRDGHSFKVRFSNHKPIARREDAGDRDFFVGVANRKTTTTAQALEAVRWFFYQKRSEIFKETPGRLG